MRHFYGCVNWLIRVHLEKGRKAGSYTLQWYKGIKVTFIRDLITRMGDWEILSIPGRLRDYPGELACLVLRSWHHLENVAIHVLAESGKKMFRKSAHLCTSTWKNISELAQCYDSMMASLLNKLAPLQNCFGILTF